MYKGISYFLLQFWLQEEHPMQIQVRLESYLQTSRLLRETYKYMFQNNLINKHVLDNTLYQTAEKRYKTWQPGITTYRIPYLGMSCWKLEEYYVKISYVIKANIQYLIRQEL